MANREHQGEVSHEGSAKGIDRATTGPSAYKCGGHVEVFATRLQRERPVRLRSPATALAVEADIGSPTSRIIR